MKEFFMLLADIEDQIKRMRVFWQTPHLPHSAVAMIKTMRHYEEDLCTAIQEGTPEEISIATEAYYNLLPLLRNAAYQLEETAAPGKGAEAYEDDS